MIYFGVTCSGENDVCDVNTTLSPYLRCDEFLKFLFQFTYGFSVRLSMKKMNVI